MWKDENNERLNRYKKILMRSPLFLYAAEKSAANGPESTDSADAAVQNVCSYVMAPALCSYVLWILNEAMKKNIRRIYFLARDAYFMYISARIFCQAFDLPIECRYLFCSRFSLRIPMYHLDLNAALDLICLGGIDVTITKILNRAGLDQSEKEIVLKELRKNSGFEYADEEPIPHAKLGIIREMLKKCPVFTGSIVKRSKESFPLLLGYLKQEGLADRTSFAFADSGWGGTMQKSLNKAVSYINGAQENSSQLQAEGFYWGLYEMPADVDPESYHCYYFSPGYNIQEKIFFSNCLFETIFSAPHGMTLGYSFENGVYSPVYASVSGEQKAFIKQTRECFETFIRELIFFAEKKNTSLKQQEKFVYLFSQTDKKIIFELLKIFMGEPNRDEARAFGCLHFSDDIIDYEQQVLAADLSEDELRANHAFAKILAMLGFKRGTLKESAWYEASAVIGENDVKWHLINYRAYKWLLYMRKERVWRKMYER